MESRVIDLLLNLDRKIDKINDKISNFVTKEECREKCNDETKKSEWSVKKVTAYTGLITVTSGGIITLIKLIFFNK